MEEVSAANLERERDYGTGRFEMEEMSVCPSEFQIVDLTCD